ncbi:MAG: metallophosphoesterase [Planctomycetota bacterium]
MRLFAIGDLHLPGGPQGKSMDRFGEVWREHARRIRENWVELHQEGDLLLIVGDLSWAMTMGEAQEDIEWIASLPGKKVILKGNHDYWWGSINRVREVFGPTVSALQRDHVLIGRLAIVGTRGWQCPGGRQPADPVGGEGARPYTEQDAKLYRREVHRLKLGLESLETSGERYDHLVIALHYPPMNPDHEPSGFTKLIDQGRADSCVHGHLHGEESIATAFEGRRGGTAYHCVSADAVEMVPRMIWP